MTMTAVLPQGSPPLPSTPAPAAPKAEPADIYVALRRSSTGAADAASFTAHVFACILSVALADARARGATLSETVGLGREDLCALALGWLPDLGREAALSSEPAAAAVDDEEEQLRELIGSNRSDASRETAWLAAMIARRAMSDNHLWQDLGLFDRSELNRLMAEHFPALAQRNSGNMKWKKFFYRMLCETEGFTLCTAPTCAECRDFDNCFGDETGESMLARIRRDVTRGS